MKAFETFETHKVALVVSVTAVVTEESHRVVLGNVLGVVGHKLLGAVPESRNGINVLVERENEAVLLVVLVHDTEGVVVDIAEELDRGLNTPVVLVVHHDLLSEEETRLESAHVAVADGVTVDDLAGGHILTNLLGLLLVNPLRERPVLLRNQTVVSLTRAERASDLLELIIEGLVVEEHPVVVVSSVESILDLTDGLSNLPNVAVSSKSDKGGVHAGTGSSAQEVVPARLAGVHGHGSVGELIGRLSGALGLNGSSTLSRLLGGNLVLGEGGIIVAGNGGGFSLREVDRVARVGGIGDSARSLLVATSCRASRATREVSNVAGDGDGLVSRVGKEVEHSERLGQDTLASGDVSW